MASLRMLYSLIVTYFSRLHFECQNLENGESWRKNARGDIFKFQHLPSIIIIASIVLFDLEFSSSNISNVNISKTVKASEKLQELTFVDFIICYGMATLRMLCFLTLTYFSRYNFKCQYLENDEN